MASRQQRSRKHARRVQHQLASRARLRAALDASAPGSWAQVTQRMREHGYVPGNRPGQWVRHVEEIEAGNRGGPSWSGIKLKRIIKKKRRRS